MDQGRRIKQQRGGEHGEYCSAYRANKTWGIRTTGIINIGITNIGLLYTSNRATPWNNSDGRSDR